METTNASEPVIGFPIKFTWNPLWEPIFDKQIETIRHDIKRAMVEEKFVTYLSCPISSKGGSFEATNIDITQYTVRKINKIWGNRVWVLNPSQYQFESKVGRNLIMAHAEESGIDIAELPDPSGGDYMRMWTKILVEDEQDNLGGFFDMFYFLSPGDVFDFFKESGNLSISSAVEDYFSRKVNIDSGYRDYFMPPFKDNAGNILSDVQQEAEWSKRRNDFLRYYTIKASANYSKGSHDEWNIWVLLNRLRIEKYGIGSQIPGYFNDSQISIGASESSVTKGYAE
jgi:hypothetical protein